MSEEKEHSFKQLQKLVYPEQLDMMRQGHYLEETMPTGQSEAVVLCLDIINSTSMDPDNHHVFFADFFVQCQHIMNEGITVSGEKVQLFRVKEVGDGLICSIGFPFPCKANWVEVALAFADKVVALFWECAQHHLGDKPCGLGIGIAGGAVGGYFPKSGIIQYDLYGMAIVLATRYEGMRRHLADRIEDGESIVIVQDKVHRELGKEAQKQFECVELDRAQFKVRDDPDASQVWFKVVTRSVQAHVPKIKLRTGS